MNHRVWTFVALVAQAVGCSGRVRAPGAGQVKDPSFQYTVKNPAYRPGQGPTVLVDEAHCNFHTVGGRYRPFARLLRADGYVVKPFRRKFTPESLRAGRILVIANALDPRNEKNWTVPIHPAFAKEEVVAVRNWVNRGGRLLLIADHMPLPAAAAGLAAAFGVKFTNGFAWHRDRINRPGPMIFRRSDGTLADHPITNGRNARERVDSVATFTGQAFRAPPGARPLLTFGPGVISLMPKTAWRFTSKTPRVPVAGWLQGAVMRYGSGRVAFFGEAAMFTAQVGGKRRRKMGMNAPKAKQNPQFLLNVLHWLSGLLEP